MSSGTLKCRPPDAPEGLYFNDLCLSLKFQEAIVVTDNEGYVTRFSEMQTHREPFGVHSFVLQLNLFLELTKVIVTGNFTCLEIVFSFRRRLGYYLFHTYVPTCLIVIMSWISFWIRPEAVPARVTLGVTSLLTLSTQHANSQKSLPPVSYIKVRRIFLNF
jgi:Neurotransmitter-gated ion-channel transmembrane region